MVKEQKTIVKLPPASCIIIWSISSNDYKSYSPTKKAKEVNKLYSFEMHYVKQLILIYLYKFLYLTEMLWNASCRLLAGVSSPFLPI